MDHVPLGEGQVVEEVGHERELWDAERGQQGLLPEVGTAQVTGERVNANEDQDALDGPVDDAERERLGVVLVPGLDVEGEQGSEEGRDRLPALAHVLRGGEDEDFERGVERVDAVVKELAQRARLVGATTICARLCQQKVTN